MKWIFIRFSLTCENSWNFLIFVCIQYLSPFLNSWINCYDATYFAYMWMSICWMNFFHCEIVLTRSPLRPSIPRSPGGPWGPGGPTSIWIMSICVKQCNTIQYNRKLYKYVARKKFWTYLEAQLAVCIAT